MRWAGVVHVPPYADGVHAAALRIELYLRECRSLKAKRALIRPVIEGLARRHRVSVWSFPEVEVLRIDRLWIEEEETS